MPADNHLANAPIVEALIDFRVDLPAGVGMEDIKQACKEISHAYPTQRERHRWTGQISIRPRIPTAVQTSHDNPDGMIAEADAERRIVQYRLDGFTFSQLKPYATWEKLRDEAVDLWNIYVRHLRPQQVTRVAVRYINSLAIPADHDLRDYLKTTFVVADNLPQSVGNFLLKLHIPYPEQSAHAILTEAMDEQRATTSPNVVSVLLDIDVFCEESTHPDGEAVWNRLEVLRSIKNDLFFKSVSELLLEQYR